MHQQTVIIFYHSKYIREFVRNARSKKSNRGSRFITELLKMERHFARPIEQ